RRLALRQRGAVLVVRVRRRDRARRGARRAVAPDPLGAAQPPGAPAGVLGARHRAARRRARPDPAPLARRAASLPRGRTHVSKILVTGGAGFIGSNFVRMLLQETAYEVVNLDALTYAGNLENLTEVERDPRYTFVRADITDRREVDAAFKAHRPDFVVHFAAESHV